MKKIVRQLTAVLIVISLIFTLGLTSFANDATTNNHDEFADQYLIAYLKSVFNVDARIVNTVYLHGADNSNFIYYEISIDGNVGYAIMDESSFVIPEIALDHTPAFDVTDQTVYAGLFTYIVREKENYYNLNSKQIVSAGNLEKLGQSQKLLRQNVPAIKRAGVVNTVTATNSVVKIITGSGNNSWLYNSGSYYGDCGINCIAMLEKYYDLYVNSSYLPSTLTSESQIKQSVYNYIVNNTGYSSTGINEYNFADIVTRHSMSVGNGVYLYATTSAYSWSAVCKKINANRPVAISIRNHPTFSYHYVIVCGFTDTADLSTSRLYVNSGWTSQGFIWIDQSYGYFQVPCV